MAKTVVGLYDELSAAQQVVQDLVNEGFSRDNISMVARDPEGHYASYLGQRGTTADQDTTPAATEGAIAGGILGGLGGLLLGLGALAIPGVGPIIAAGPIVAGLVGAGLGAATGGLLGALVGWGIPEEEAGYYAESVRRGSTLVAVNTPEGQVDRVIEIMNRYNPVDIEQRAAEWQQTGWSGYSASSEPYSATQIEQERERYRTASSPATIPVVEEELRVGKREVERGGVRVRTYVEEKPVQEQVQLRQERVTVERHPVNRPADQTDISEAFSERTIEMTETVEEAVIEKRPRVVEEVVIGKEVYEQPHTIQETVRRTDVDVQELGVFDTYREDFMHHYQTNYGNTGLVYTKYEPAYRYGYDLGGEERYRSRTWEEIEPEVRRDWEARYSDQGMWEDFKDSIHYAWNRIRGSV